MSRSPEMSRSPKLRPIQIPFGRGVLALGLLALDSVVEHAMHVPDGAHAVGRGAVQEQRVLALVAEAGAHLGDQLVGHGLRRVERTALPSEAELFRSLTSRG